MNLYLRAFKIIILSFFRKRLGPLETGIVKFRVWPNDIDINFHLNDGRYVSVMDLGRLDLTLRNGLLTHCIKNRWFPVVASVMVRYVKSIKPFQKYRVETCILGWDDDWFYFFQRFLCGGELLAAGIVRTVFLRNGSKVKSEDIVTSLYGKMKSPEIPEWIKEWNKSENMMKSMK